MEFNTVEDILEFAANAEQKAFNLYTKLSAQTNNPELIEVFSECAKESMKHRREIESIKEEGTLSLDTTGMTPQKYTEVNDYPLQMSYMDALSLAIKREKALYKLYSKIASKANEGEMKRLFSTFAQVVASHTVRFEVEYDEYTLATA